LPPRPRSLGLTRSRGQFDCAACAPTVA
jgi:hypothetical protein